MACDATVGCGRVPELGNGDGEGDGLFGGSIGAVDALEKGDGDVVGVAAGEEVVGDFQGEVALGAGNLAVGIILEKGPYV